MFYKKRIEELELKIRSIQFCRPDYFLRFKVEKTTYIDEEKTLVNNKWVRPYLTLRDIEKFKKPHEDITEITVFIHEKNSIGILHFKHTDYEKIERKIDEDLSYRFGYNKD